MDRTENTEFNNSSLIECVFVAARRIYSSGTTIPAFRRHVTLHSKVIKEDTKTHRQQDDLKNLLLCLQNKESKLKMNRKEHGKKW
jgi:hypothetical protein